jgi:hypothetical protein
VTQTLNFILFQLGWFTCVLGAANNAAWLGPVSVLAIVIIHLVLSLRPSAEMKLVLWAMALGLATDSLLLASGWLAYPGGSLAGFFAPYWIVAMWGLFATTLNVSMRWLKGRFGLAVLMGAVGGPLSYYGGQKLGAMVFIAPVQALIALSIAWAIAMPLLMRLAKRFDGVTPRRSAELTSLPWQVSSHA